MKRQFYYAHTDDLGVLCVDRLNGPWTMEQVAALGWPDTIYFYVDPEEEGEVGMTEAEVRTHLLANPEAVIDTVVSIFKMLGSEFEWSMEHNFCATESIARLADAYGLPSVDDQSVDDLVFWQGLGESDRKSGG